MRNIIGFIVGLYLTVALAVFGGAAWSFSTEARWKETCGPAGPNWMPWAAYRAIAWPKAWLDDSGKLRRRDDIVGWLKIEYGPWNGACP
ncbi:MAG: hypothetical protein QM773_11620 [Hyphomonadaceae bacterium]